MNVAAPAPPSLRESVDAVDPAPRPLPRGPGGRPPRSMTDAVGDPPQGARMTRAAFLARTVEYRAEWVDGRLDYLPMPRSLHLRLCARIFVLFHEHLKAVKPDANLVGAGAYVRCPSQCRSPDMGLLLDPDDPREGREEWAGADLVAEVVSPDDPDRDYVDKRTDYLAAGVREYWIVDPRPRTARDPPRPDRHRADAGAGRGRCVERGGVRGGRNRPRGNPAGVRGRRDGLLGGMTGPAAPGERWASALRVT